MKNLQNMMKQAQELQSKMADMQTKLADMEMDGEAGAGMVVVTLNGKGEMRKIKLDKQLVDPDDVETLEDLIVAATNTAKRRVEEQGHANGRRKPELRLRAEVHRAQHGLPDRWAPACDPDRNEGPANDRLGHRPRHPAPKRRPPTAPGDDELGAQALCRPDHEVGRSADRHLLVRVQPCITQPRQVRSQGLLGPLDTLGKTSLVLEAALGERMHHDYRTLDPLA